MGHVTCGTHDRTRCCWACGACPRCDGCGPLRRGDYCAKCTARIIAEGGKWNPYTKDYDAPRAPKPAEPAETAEPEVLEILPAKHPQTQYALGAEFLDRTLTLQPQESTPRATAPKAEAHSLLPLFEVFAEGGDYGR